MTNEEKVTETSATKKVAKKAPAKKAANQKTASQKIAPKKVPIKAFKAVRNYPQITIEKCLIIAQKIKELNGGNPWTPKEISQAINVGIGNNFYYYTAASRDFGFTIGTRETPQISLTELGREIVYAPNPSVEREKKVEAFLKIDILN